MRDLRDITPQSENFGRWYTDVVLRGNLIEYGPTKGSIILKPLSAKVWDNIREVLNKKFSALGTKNVYAPLLIPLADIEKEQQHIDGFLPEIALVTKVGDKELTSPFVIRPTSEVIFAHLFQKQINSYNDMPILYNQWANVLRWEKTTTPFLRNSEFLWQEGHTAHSSAKEAESLALKMIKLYVKFCRDFLAIPVIAGKKTEKEKFSGAVTTYTLEAMMKDGRALQIGTSHFLGQNFSRPFNIKFQIANNTSDYVFQTSWGVSTRLIGALIMVHGDDRGVVFPPKIAPYQIDLLELFADKDPLVKETSLKLQKQLRRGFRLQTNNSSKGPGFKASKSEIEGTPLRIEIGPRDLARGEVTLIRRDTLVKKQVKLEMVKKEAKQMLLDIQTSLYKRAKERLDKNIVEVRSYDELKKHIAKGKFVVAPFEGNELDEALIKNETLATTRCVPFDFKGEINECIITKKRTRRYVVFSKNY